MSYIRLNYLAALVLGVLSVPVATAQSVVFSGTTNPSTTGPYTVPLQVGTFVTVEADGDIRVTCQPNGTGCVGFPTGGTTPPANAPTVSLSSSSGATVNVGTNFTISATLGNNPESCLRTSSPNVAGWDGPVLPGLANGAVSLSQAVQHTFSLKCFNDGGSGSGNVIVTGIGGGGGEPTACSTTAPPPTTHTRDNSVLQLANLPISSQAQDFKFTAARYLAMGFKGTTNFPGSTSLTFAVGTVGGATLRYSGFYLAISPCQGDFRLPVNAANTSEPTLAPGCRAYVGTPEGDFMLVNFNSGGPSNSFCNLDPTKDYFVNIILDDPTDGLSNTSPDECITTACGNGLSIR